MQVSRNSSTRGGGGAGGGGGSNTTVVAASAGSTGGLAATSNSASSNQVASQAQQNQQQQQQVQQPASSSIVRDIVNLRKQIVSHPWFISMEDTLNKQYIPSKSLRKFKQNSNNLHSNDITKINTESLLQSGQLSSFPFELPPHITGGQLTFLATATVNNNRGTMDGNATINTSGINLSNPSASMLNFMKSEKVISASIPNILLGSNNASNVQASSNQQSEDPDMEFEKPEMKNFSYTYAYTQQDRKKEITVKLHDLKKLLPNQYLNDSIVNFFLKFFEVEMLTEQMQEKVLIFNTYFMSKLAPNEQIDSINSSEPAVMQPMFEKNYQTVRRWIKEDIFEKDFLVFPLNLPEHWSVAIVCNHRKLLADQKEKITKKKEEKEQKLESNNNNKKMEVEEVNNQQKEKTSEQNTKGKDLIVVIDGKEQQSQKMEEEIEQDKDNKSKDKNSLTEEPTAAQGNGSIAPQIGQLSVNKSETIEEAANKETTMEIEDKHSTGGSAVDATAVATSVDSTKALSSDKVVVVSDEKAAEVAAAGTGITAIVSEEEEVVEVVKTIKKDSPAKESAAATVVAPRKASVSNEDDEDDYSSDSDSSSYSCEIDQTDNTNPCILYFDSFGLLDAKYSTMIRLYIQRELTHKLKQLQDKHDSKQEQPQKHIEVNEITLPSRQPLIPRQTNYVDCGLYLLEYVEDFLNSTSTQRSVFTSNSSDDWVQLNWFPRCNITSKRRFIKELILDLSSLPLTQAVQNYKQKRKQLLDERSDKSEEYDEVDMEEFEDHLEDIIESEYDYPETDMERHRMLLDFYMNPSYNKYEVV